MGSFAGTAAGGSNELVVSGAVGIGTSSPNANVAIDMGNITTAVILPKGTTGQEPSSPVAGMFRYNSTTPALKSYYNSTWNTLLSTNSLGTTIPAAGSSGQVEYDNGGVLGGAAAITYATSGNLLSV